MICIAAGHVTENAFNNLRPWQTRTRCCRHKCFPVCPRAQHLLRKVCVRDNKNVSDFVQKHFVSRAFAHPRNIMSSNVSATMCPRLPGPLRIYRYRESRENFLLREFSYLWFVPIKYWPKELSGFFSIPVSISVPKPALF